MKTKLIACFVFCSGAFAASGAAQTVQNATPEPADSAPVLAVAPTPDQTVYAQRLPSVNELSSAAAAQGRTVDRIEQNASQVTVVYKSASGQTTTIAYLLLPNATGTSAAPVAAPTTPAPTVIYPAAPSTVYYEPAPRVIYYDDYAPRYYSYPSYWYPPVSIGLGFGFRSGGFHGGHSGHGGFRGGIGFHR